MMQLHTRICLAVLATSVCWGGTAHCSERDVNRLGAQFKPADSSPRLSFDHVPMVVSLLQEVAPPTVEAPAPAATNDAAEAVAPPPTPEAAAAEAAEAATAVDDALTASAEQSKLKELASDDAAKAYETAANVYQQVALAYSTTAQIYLLAASAADDNRTSIMGNANTAKNAADEAKEVATMANNNAGEAVAQEKLALQAPVGKGKEAHTAARNAFLSALSKNLIKVTQLANQAQCELTKAKGQNCPTPAAAASSAASRFVATFAKSCGFTVPGCMDPFAVSPRTYLFVYEGMTVEAQVDGQYEVKFVVEAPRVPVTIRMQLVICDCDGAEHGTVTLAPIVVEPCARLPHQHSTESFEVRRVGYSKLLAEISKKGWHLERRGMARIGGVPESFAAAN